MSYQIIKQPDGKFAVWSTIVDDFVLLDCTEQDIADEWVCEDSARIRNRVNEICTALNRGEKPYYQFTMTWDEANEERREVHKERG